jgi:hypothetical protein
MLLTPPIYVRRLQYDKALDCIADGMHVDTTDADGYTSLMIACEQGSLFFCHNTGAVRGAS